MKGMMRKLAQGHPFIAVPGQWLPGNSKGIRINVKYSGSDLEANTMYRSLVDSQEQRSICYWCVIFHWVLQYRCVWLQRQNIHKQLWRKAKAEKESQPANLTIQSMFRDLNCLMMEYQGCRWTKPESHKPRLKENIICDSQIIYQHPLMFIFSNCTWSVGCWMSSSIVN